MDIYAIGFECFSQVGAFIRLCKVARWEVGLVWEASFENDEMYRLLLENIHHWKDNHRLSDEGHIEAAAKVARAMGVPFIGEITNGAKPYYEGDI